MECHSQLANCRQLGGVVLKASFPGGLDSPRVQVWLDSDLTRSLPVHVHEAEPLLCSSCFFLLQKRVSFLPEFSVKIYWLNGCCGSWASIGFCLGSWSASYLVHGLGGVSRRYYCLVHRISPESHTCVEASIKQRPFLDAVRRRILLFGFCSEKTVTVPTNAAAHVV